MTNSAAPAGVSFSCRGGDARYDSAAEPIPSPGKALLTHCVSSLSGKVQRRSGVFIDVLIALMRAVRTSGLYSTWCEKPLLVCLWLSHAEISSCVQLFSNAGGSYEDALAGAPHHGGTA